MFSGAAPKLPIPEKVRIGVCHLKGVHRGRVETLDGPVVRIGTAPHCELRLKGAPGVRREHAELRIRGTDVHLQPAAPVALNGTEVGEVVVQNYDVLEVGRTTMMRLRLLPGDTVLPPQPAARRRPPMLLLGLLILTLALCTAFVAVRSRDAEAELSARIESEAEWSAVRQHANDRRLKDLQADVRELGKRVANRIEVDRRVGEVQRAVAEVESNVLSRVTTEIERSLGNNPDLRAARDAVHAAERIIATQAAGVCLIQGAYGFGRADKDGKWRFLREAEPEVLGEIDEEGGKVPLMLEGEGPLFKVEFTGTGFLADASGIVLTNRHIAQPWWRNEAAKPLLDSDFKPRFMYLRAYFPKLAKGIEIDLSRTVHAEEADLSALQLEATSEKLPAPLKLARPDSIVAGRRVLLLGYPSGLSALLARSEESFSERVRKSKDFDPLRVLDELASRGLIRPLPTGGHVSDLVGDKVLFDAPTAVGGSGGPLLDMRGHVVAVNYGILKSFSGANFGVSVEHATTLLDRAKRGTASALSRR